MDGNKITKENLIRKMKSLSDLYDVVRLVEPESTSVVVLGEHGLEVTEHEPCFSVWEKDQRCTNCISLRACVENRKLAKFEFRREEAYSVLAMPYTVIDDENEYRVSLELVNRVQENMVLQAEGMDERAKQIMEFNMKIYQDSLTGAFNRRYYDEHRYIYGVSHVMPKKLGYLIIDVDHFKKINDTYGHQCGDEVLAKVVETLKANVRNTDSVMRIGGDEFLIVMQNCDRPFVEKKKTQLKQAVCMIYLPWLENQTLSISVGIAFTDEFTGKQEQLSALFGHADKELYADKKHMRSKQEQLTVLVVDDIEMNRALARKIIEKRYKVMEAANGVEALEILNSNQIDVIITDIFMDPMNGYELMQKVKAIPHFRDIPIIAVTENSESSQRKAIEAGADIYIDRSLGGYNLLDIVQRLTGMDFGRRELFDVDFLLDTIPGAVLVCKLHGTEVEVVSCSRGISQISGWNADEFCHEEIIRNKQNIFPADMELLKNAIGRMVRTHSRTEIIYRAYKKDGSLVWIWLQGRYIGKEDGCPIMEAILLDVSANTDMYQLMLDETNAMVTIIDAETYEVVYANKKAIASSSMGEEYVGCTCYKGIHNKGTPCRDCLLLKSEDAPAEVKRVTYAGHTYKMLRKRMIWNQRKVLLEYSEDITDEVRAAQLEDELNKERQQLIDQVPTGIGIYEVKNNILSQIYMNNAFYGMIKSTREGRRQYFANNALESVYPEDVQKIRATVQDLMNGKNITQGDCRLINGNGDWIWLHGIASVVERTENYLKLYCAFYECTESKQQQLQLLQNQRAVELAEQQGRISIWTYNIDKGIMIHQTIVGGAGRMGYPNRIVSMPNGFIRTGNIHPEDEEKFITVYRRLANGEEKLDEIYRVKNQCTGEYDWVHMYYQRMENNDDGDRMAVGFLLQINTQQEAIERYRTEQKLREQMYANAVMYTEYNLTDSNYEGENSLTERYLKQNWEKQTIEEYRENIATIVDADYLDLFVEKMYAANLLKAFDNGETKASCEYRSVRRPNMPSQWYRTTAVMAKRPDTGDVMAFIYIENIDAEKNRQIAIESSTSDGIEIISVIHIADGKARVVRSNYILAPGGLGEYFTYDDEFVHRSHMSVVSEDREFSYHAALLPTVRQQLETKDIYQYSISTKRQDKKLKRQLFRFRYLDDRKTHIILSVSDITAIYLEEQEKNKKLEAALSEANAANKAKTNFLSRVSHDMRTPLNGILGLTTLLKDSVTDQDVLRDLDELEMSGKYLLDLINDTLDMSRIESGNLELHPIVYDGRKMFNNAIRMGKMSIQGRNITFNIHTQNTPFTLLYVDVSRVEQIFMNVFGNAAKFTPDGGTIDFTMTNVSVENRVITNKLVISDTGIGMSPEFLPHIFEAFTQADASKTSTAQGTGLGMAITKQLIELMGGSISVESELGKGTTFTLILKLHMATDEQIEEWKKTRNVSTGGVRIEGKRVLLVEDHPLNTQIATRLLKAKGVMVEHAENGQVGVDMFHQSAIDYYDAILMDIRMPIMDGIEATKAIRNLVRADAQTVPIIAMTANAFADDIEQTQAAGMNGHLSKPIEADVLFATLAERMRVPQFAQKQRILVVDDTEMNRAMIRATLEKDYEILEAENGKQAMEMLRQTKGVDAVITDIQMPEMDGIELIRQIRSDKKYRRMVIIANTQFGNPDQEELLLSLGANDFVYKPTTPTIVEIRVRNALKSI